MLRWILAAFLCFLLSVGVMAQESKSDSLPEAPSQTQQSAQIEQSSQPQQPATPQSTPNPIQGSVEVFKLLQRKSLVFPDLATAQGPLSSWDKIQAGG